MPMLRSEHCKNPWNGKCKCTEIELYIIYDGKKIPICRKCWSEIAEKEIEWVNFSIHIFVKNHFYLHEFLQKF